MDQQTKHEQSEMQSMDSCSEEITDHEHFLTKGAFLLTPANQLHLERIALICEKMNYKGSFSLTKTATGILFRFAEIDDYLITFRKGFHKVTGSRFYKKIPIPCRPQKTFTIFVFDIPDEIPVDDIRHSLYKFRSVIEVCRLPSTISSTIPAGTVPTYLNSPTTSSGSKRYSLTEGMRRKISSFGGTVRPWSCSSEKNNTATRTVGSINDITFSGTAALTAGLSSTSSPSSAGSTALSSCRPTTAIRITLASLDECNSLLKDGMDFYRATYFPTEPALATTIASINDGGKTVMHNSRLLDLITSSGLRVRDLMPIYDYPNYSKIPKPVTKTVTQRNHD